MLKMEITELHVATSDHNGFVKVHINKYLGQAAQKHIDTLVAGNKDISAATLISEPQTIIIEARRRTTSPEKLKDIVRGFNSALVQWYDQLDDVDLGLMSYHPNPKMEEFLGRTRVNMDY